MSLGMVRCARLAGDQGLWDPISPSGNVGTFIPDQTNTPLGLIAFGPKLVLDPLLETDLDARTNSGKA